MQKMYPNFARCSLFKRSEFMLMIMGSQKGILEFQARPQYFKNMFNTKSRKNTKYTKMISF